MEYILHIGMMKTGSTSLQRALSGNRETLRRYGVIYPKTGRRGDKHYELRRVLCRGATPEFFDMPEDWVERFHSETAGADICVISDELFSIREHDPETVTSLIPRRRTRVVMYIREPVAHAVSLYQERMKNLSMRMSLRDFAGKRRLSYFREAERWARVFGRENVIIRLYGRDDGNWDIISDFADVIGLKREDVFPRLEERERELNPGMAGNLFFVKSVLNHFITLEESRSIKHEVKKLRYLDEKFRGKIPVDQETVNMIACRYREELEDLDKHYGLSVIPRDRPIDAYSCPDPNELAHDFARIYAWAHERKSAMALLLQRIAGMFA